jgi:hypothetical protein
MPEDPAKRVIAGGGGDIVLLQNYRIPGRLSRGSWRPLNLRPHFIALAIPVGAVVRKARP